MRIVFFRRRASLKITIIVSFLLLCSFMIYRFSGSGGKRKGTEYLSIDVSCMCVRVWHMHSMCARLKRNMTVVIPHDGKLGKVKWNYTYL